MSKGVQHLKNPSTTLKNFNQLLIYLGNANVSTFSILFHYCFTKSKKQFFQEKQKVLFIYKKIQKAKLSNNNLGKNIYEKLNIHQNVCDVARRDTQLCNEN
jgi:hypothetical protein